jgi:hypothetical protein
MHIPPTDGASASSDSAPHFVDEVGPGQVQAWEEIETGRYMPRRIRGSYQGRALG